MRNLYLTNHSVVRAAQRFGNAAQGVDASDRDACRAWVRANPASNRSIRATVLAAAQEALAAGRRANRNGWVRTLAGDLAIVIRGTAITTVGFSSQL